MQFVLYDSNSAACDRVNNFKNVIFQISASENWENSGVNIRFRMLEWQSHTTNCIVKV